MNEINKNLRMRSSREDMDAKAPEARDQPIPQQAGETSGGQLHLPHLVFNDVSEETTF